ncbi:hypothetical protein NEMBOFW57_003588 [Staphylotrichum longicolle]|uniref:Ipa protein n=1 Tax=Staphylotrichum longicolle TaxID=669026 RepID=A0AAD4I3G4_9PEZI|nr:hypothetical protein NEMBOFW57_003588 [Staphylotrichum longicolle]
MAASTSESALKEVHRDLARKYKRHEATIDTLWRSFDANQRSRCLKAGAADGVVLKHPLDESLGNVCKFIPECNLRDIAQSGPDFLLTLLKHRATTSLFDQYCSGDSVTVQPFHNCFTLFLDENHNGESYKINGAAEGLLDPLAPAIRAGLCVPHAVQGAAIWDYIYRLLALFEAQDADNDYQAIILQELSNVSHMEYDRAHALFRRSVQTGTGAKFFRRQPGSFDNVGNAVVSMKCNLGKLAKSDAHLHFIMRLCDPGTSAKQSIEWLKKLAEFNKSDPTAQDRLLERETDALSGLVLVVGFIQDLSTAISMPPLSRRKGQMFVSRSRDLEAELNDLKNQVDLLDYASQIDNLLEPGMAEGALRKLDQFVIDEVGTKMGFLYGDLVQDCLALLESQCRQAKTRMEQAKAREEQERRMDWIPIPVPPPQPRENALRSGDRKKRPAQPTPQPTTLPRLSPAATEPAAEEAPPPQTFKVSPSTAGVFSALFDKTQSRGSVNWVDFEGAMAELGFSVLPKFGSVYTFLPPKSMGTGSVTLHRPHKSRIEGYSLLIFARRLKRV